MLRSKQGERRTLSPLPVAGCVTGISAVVVFGLFAFRTMETEQAWIFLIVCAMLGMIPAAIAKSKGRSVFLWWIYGTYLFIVALPHALLMKPSVQAIEREKLASGDSRRCPFCAEIVKRQAVVCRYCGRDLPSITTNVIAEGARGKLGSYGRGKVFGYLFTGEAGKRYSRCASFFGELIV
jgi:hypothetical protein